MFREANDSLAFAIHRGLRVLAKAPVRLAFAIGFTAFFLGGALFSIFEHDASLLDGLYWATVVMPTVGFGDFSPHTEGGRVVYEYVVVSGWISTLMLGGAFAGAIAAHDINYEHEETPEIDDDLAFLAKNLESAVSDIKRLNKIASHPYVKDALVRVHQERNHA